MLTIVFRGKFYGGKKYPFEAKPATSSSKYSYKKYLLAFFKVSAFLDLEPLKVPLQTQILVVLWLDFWLLVFITHAGNLSSRWVSHNVKPVTNECLSYVYTSPSVISILPRTRILT